MERFNVESKLADMDFSRFSKVKGSLFNKLTAMSMAGRMGITRLSESNLDLVVAAGTPTMAQKSRE